MAPSSSAPPVSTLNDKKEVKNVWTEIFDTLETPEHSSLAQHIGLFIIIIICVSSLNFILETMPVYQTQDPLCAPDCPPSPNIEFWYIECVSMFIFTVEYLGRVLTVHKAVFPKVLKNASSRSSLTVRTGSFGALIANSDAVGSFNAASFNLQEKIKETKKKSAVLRTLSYILIPINLVDLMAILPFYIELVLKTGSGFAVLRILRLARVFRVFKLAKYNEGFRMFGRVMSQSLEALYLLLFFMILAVVIFGSMIFVAESGEWNVETQTFVRDVNGVNVTSPFSSIPQSFWWVIVTSTTVGYGDMVPVTLSGRIIGMVTMFAGILVLALPITVIGSNFSMEYMSVAGDIIKTTHTGHHRNSGVAPSSEGEDNSSSSDRRKSKAIAMQEHMMKTQPHKAMMMQRRMTNNNNASPPAPAPPPAPPSILSLNTLPNIMERSDSTISSSLSESGDNTTSSIINRIKALDINKTSPIECLKFLKSIQDELLRED